MVVLPRETDRRSGQRSAKLPTTCGRTPVCYIRWARNSGWSHRWWRHSWPNPTRCWEAGRKLSYIRRGGHDSGGFAKRMGCGVLRAVERGLVRGCQRPSRRRIFVVRWPRFKLTAFRSSEIVWRKKCQLKMWSYYELPIVHQDKELPRPSPRTRRPRPCPILTRSRPRSHPSGELL